MSAAPTMEGALTPATATSTQPPVKRRGRKRRQTPEAPCQDCIQRAALNNARGGLPLCNDCAQALGEARRPLTKSVAKSSAVRKQYRRNVKPNLQRQAATNLLKANPEANASAPAPRAKEMFTELPSIFSTLIEAYNTLQPVHGRLAMLIMHTEAASQPVVTPFIEDAYRSRAQQWLKTWESSFAQFLSGMIEHMSADERKAAMTLKAHHLMAKCFASVQLVETQLDWTVFGFEFEAVLNLAEAVMSDVVVQPQYGQRRSIDGFQTTLPQITILDPVFEVRIRSTDIALVDWAMQLQATIQATHLAASPDQNSHNVHAGLQKA